MLMDPTQTWNSIQSKSENLMLNLTNVRGASLPRQQTKF